MSRRRDGIEIACESCERVGLKTSSGVRWKSCTGLADMYTVLEDANLGFSLLMTHEVMLRGRPEAQTGWVLAALDLTDATRLG